MPTMNLPVSTYATRAAYPNTRLGSPAYPVINSASWMLSRVTFDALPIEATILKATLRFRLAKNYSGTFGFRATNITKDWTSSVTWNTRPTYSSDYWQTNKTNPRRLSIVDVDVTAWAVTRSRYGLILNTTSGASSYLQVCGSASAWKPILIVDYTTDPKQPTNLVPNGGVVSVPKPPLTYVGDPFMIEQRVEMSLDGGATVTYDSGWVPATVGYFEQPAETPTPAVDTDEVSWRVTVRSDLGTSVPSGWAAYTYHPLPVVTITNPPATSPDGSPTLTWTAPDESEWNAVLYDGVTGAKVDSSGGWHTDPDAVAWTPSKGVPVPDGSGRFELQIRDALRRVVAVGAPTATAVEQEFTTTLEGVGNGVDTLVGVWDEPVMRLSGTRAAGVPDEVTLVRDGVVVTIWSPDGEPGLRLPGSYFFTGTDFEIVDYTADPRHEHTWQLLTWTDGVPSAVNPSVTQSIMVNSVWLVNPQTDDKAEIVAIEGVPAIEQETTEATILHTPLNANVEGMVEPIRRRLTRSTRAGTITGAVLNENEDMLEEWSLDGSNVRYRLVFGKVNWPVIIGDYSPADEVWLDACGPERTAITLGWWQRLSDF